LPTLAKHKGVRALDLWGVAGEKATELERLAAENVKRVTRRSLDDAAWYDDRAGVSPSQIEPFVETKSVWHPVGV
jgi:hypothetical protein